MEQNDIDNHYYSQQRAADTKSAARNLEKLRKFLEVENSKQIHTTFNARFLTLVNNMRQGDKDKRQDAEQDLGLLVYYSLSADFKYVGNSLREDAIQTTLIKVLQVARDPEKKFSDPSSYVGFALQNNITTLARKQNKDRKHASEINDDPSLAKLRLHVHGIDEGTPDIVSENQQMYKNGGYTDEEYAALHQAINKLDGRQKPLVKMFYSGKAKELGYKGMAETLDIPPASVKSALSRGRKKLKRILETDHTAIYEEQLKQKLDYIDHISHKTSKTHSSRSR